MKCFSIETMITFFICLIFDRNRESYENMAVNGGKLMKMDGNGLKWMEMAVNSCKYLEIYGNG